MKYKTIVVLSALLLSLTGCGGGGGGGGGGSNNNAGAVGGGGIPAGVTVESPQTIDNGGAFPFEPRLAVNGAGTALLSWSQPSLFPPIFVNSFSPQAGWATLTKVVQSAETSYKTVSIDSNGDGSVSWRDSDNDGIASVTFVSGVLAAPLPLSSNGILPFAAAGPQTGPVATVVWREPDQVGFKIVLSSFLISAGWTAPIDVPLQTATEMNAGSPPPLGLSLARVGISDAGDALVVWGTNTDIRASLCPFQQGCGEARILANEPANNRSALAVAGDGSAIYAWVIAQEGGLFQVHAAFFNGTTWDSPTTLDPDFAGILDVDGIQAVFDAQGNGTVMWQHMPNPNSLDTQAGVRIASLQAGQWGSAQTLNPLGGDPDLAVNAQGDKVVAWVSEENQLVAKKYDNTTQVWGELIPVLVKGRTAVDPQVGLGTDGTILLVWAELDNSFWSTRILFP